MGRKPVGKVAMTPAERQRLYMQRLKDEDAANGKQSRAQQIVTDEKTRRQMEAMGREPTSGASSGDLRGKESAAWPRWSSGWPRMRKVG